jgi:MFS family permease
MTECRIPVDHTAPGLSSFAPALQSRNFRLFWVGQTVSTMGTYLQMVAESWLLYEITGSTFLLGLAGFIGLLPVVPISLLGGVVVDRVPRRRLILVTQAGLMVQALIFGLLAVTGAIRVWHIIILDFVMGALFAVDQPARQAFLVEIVSDDTLANAVALNSAFFQFSRVIGQAISGALIAAMGAGAAMLINAATYVAPVFAVAMIRVKDVPRDTMRAPLGIALSEGLTTLWKRFALIGTISLMAIVGGLPMAVSQMMPAYAQEVLGTTEVGLGLLLASSALGALLSTMVVARMGAGRRGRTLTACSFVVPLLLIGFAFSRSVPVSCLVMLGIGLVQSILHAMATTLVQVNVPDRVRGRVMSLNGMLIIGTPKMMGVLIGALAEHLGLPPTLGLFGIVALVYALGISAFLPSIRSLD